MMLDVSFFLLGLNVNSLVSDSSGLPPGAIAYASFKNGTYYYGGNALSDFLVADDYWYSWSPDSVITGQGYVAPGGNEGPAFAPALTAQLIASGFTAVIDFTVTLDFSGNFGGISFDMQDKPTGSQDISAAINCSPQAVQLGDNHGITTGPAVVSGVLHRAAFTMSPTHLALSIDGGAPITHEISDSFICNFIGAGLNHGVWEDLVLYPIQIDADLPALSTH